MKIIVDRQRFVEAIDRIAPVVKARTPRPVYACVKIDAPREGGDVHFTGTNGDITMHVTEDSVSVEKPGTTLIPFEKLRQIAKLDQSATLTLETNAEHATVIRTMSSVFTIYGFDPKEFPVVEWAPPAEWQASLDSYAFASQINQVWGSTAVQPGRYAVAGVLVGINKKKVFIVATESHKIAISGKAVEKPDHAAIIPRDTARLLANNSEEGQQIAFAFTDTGMFAEIGAAVRIHSTLIEGTFPPYLDAIPKDQDKQVSLKVEALRHALRAAALLTNEETKGVRMCLNGTDSLRLSSRAPEQGEAEVECAIEDRKGGNIEIGFNPKFLLDTFDTFDGNQIITMHLSQPNKPAHIKIGSDYQAAVSPVNIQ